MRTGRAGQSQGRHNIRLRIGDLDRRHRSAGRLAVIVIRPDATSTPSANGADRGIGHLLILPGGFAEQAGRVARTRRVEAWRPSARIMIAGPICAASSISIRPGGSPPLFCATCAAPRPGGQWAASSPSSGALAEELSTRPMPARLPLTSVVSVATPCLSASRIILLAGRSAGDRPGASLYRVDRGHERFRRMARSVAAEEAGHRPVGGATPRRTSRAAHPAPIASDAPPSRRSALPAASSGREPAFLRWRPRRSAGFPKGSQAGVDPVQLRRPGRALRRPRFPRGSRPWRLAAAMAEVLRQRLPRKPRSPPDRPFSRRPRGSVRPRLRAAMTHTAHATTW